MFLAGALLLTLSALLGFFGFTNRHRVRSGLLSMP